jgi:hypothetical protein
LSRLWRRLAQPVDPVAAAEVLAGIPHLNARLLLAVAVATSPEAEELIDGIPTVLRSLAVSTATRPIRCEGEIRGPVLWSETMAARAASPGAGGVFVCSSPMRAYDTDENRVLVAALTRLYRAALAAELAVEHDPRPAAQDVHRARRNGDVVRRAMEHRSLQAVTRVHANGRMLQKARTGTKAGVFRTAVALLQRSWAESGADDLDSYVDAETRIQHDLAADVLDTLDARGNHPGRLLVSGGSLTGGAFTFRHPRSPAVLEQGLPAGVFIGGRPVTSLTDVPATH